MRLETRRSWRRSLMQLKDCNVHIYLKMLIQLIDTSVTIWIYIIYILYLKPLPSKVSSIHVSLIAVFFWMVIVLYKGAAANHYHSEEGAAELQQLQTFPLRAKTSSISNLKSLNSQLFPMSGSAYIAGVGITKLESASKSIRDYPDLGAEAARVSRLFLCFSLSNLAKRLNTLYAPSLPEMLRRCR